MPLLVQKGNDIITVNKNNYKILTDITEKLKKIDIFRVENEKKFINIKEETKQLINDIENKKENINISNLFKLYLIFIELNINNTNIINKINEIQKEIPSVSSLQKEKNTKIVLNSIKQNINYINQNTTSIKTIITVFFNRTNFFITQEIENGNEEVIKELFNSLGKINDNNAQILINENKPNNKLSPFSFLIEIEEDKDNNLYYITNYLEHQKEKEEIISNDFKEYFEANPNYFEKNANINDFKDIISNLNNENKKKKKLTDKQKELLSITLKKNYKHLFNKILGNPNLSDKEKINKIDKIFRENIQDNYLFIFREKAGEIFNEIFENNILAKDIFEKLIFRDKETNNINKNIRLAFIESFPNINIILDYINNPFDKKKVNEKEEKNDIKISLGVRSLLAILNRLKKEIDITKDNLLKNKYKFFLKEFENQLLKKYKSRKKELENNNELKTYKKERYEGEIKLINKYFENININSITEQNKKEIESLLNNKESLTQQDLLYKLKNNQLDSIKSEDLVKLIKKGTFAYILYDLFQNTINDNVNIENIDRKKIDKTIIETKKGSKKLIILAILENSKNFTINFLLKNNFLSQLDKEKIILDFIKKSNDTVRKIEILNIIPNSFDKKEILKILISGKNVGYNDFINILGSKYFKDINIKLFNKDGKIIEEDAEIFLKLFYKSNNEELSIQSIGMMKNYTEQLVKEGIHISPENKKYELLKDKKSLFKLKSLY